MRKHFYPDRNKLHTILMEKAQSAILYVVLELDGSVTREQKAGWGMLVVQQRTLIIKLKEF